MDKEIASQQAQKEVDAMMRKYKERIDQDFEFREAQLEARYQQLAAQMELDLQQERDVFYESKN